MIEKSGIKTINEAGIRFISLFEGLVKYIYDDHRGAKSRLERFNDAVGFPTIGIGELIKSPQEFDYWKAREPITEEQSYTLFRGRVKLYEAAVASLKTNLNQNQFNALTSLCYNIGPTRFKSSQVAQALKRGDYQLAAEKILLYRTSKGKILKGLETRRQAEKQLFNNPK